VTVRGAESGGDGDAEGQQRRLVGGHPGVLEEVRGGAGEQGAAVGALGLIHRVNDPDDGRVVRLALTAEGSTMLEKLSGLHLAELTRLADAFRLFGLDLAS
jgi:hypothetical protein